MFICQFFNENPNSVATRLTKAISRVQENNENGNPRDQDRELFIFSNMNVIHVLMPIFQWESEFCCYKVDKGHIKGPGEQRERQPQGPGQGVVHFFSNIHMILFIYQFFNGNPNFEVTSVTKAISRVQGNNENGNPRDQDRE